MAQPNEFYTDITQLNPHDVPIETCLDWCKERSNMVILQSGKILSSTMNPADIEQCKHLMVSHGIRPGAVVQASQSVINYLLGIEQAAIIEKTQKASKEQACINLINTALEEKSREIYLEIRRDYTRVRLRKAGELLVYTEYFARKGRDLVSSIIAASNIDKKDFDPNRAQNVFCDLELDGKNIGVRIATLPALGGYDMAIWISMLKEEDSILDLSSLGYQPSQIKLLERAMQAPSGVVIIAGPYHSGKNTVLMSCIKELSLSRKVITIEERLQHVLPNVTQVPLRENAGSISELTAAAMRLNPDVVVLGQVKTLQTANVMVQAAQMGQLVFVTLRSRSAIGAINRLLHLGLSAKIVAEDNILLSLVCQHLIDILCPSCRVPIIESGDHGHSEATIAGWKAAFGGLDGIYIRGSHNCDDCANSGISNRQVLAEEVWLDAPSRKYIANQDMNGWVAYLKSQGWRSYQEQAMGLVKQGQCDPMDAQGVIGQIDEFTFNDKYQYE